MGDKKYKSNQLLKRKLTYPQNYELEGHEDPRAIQNIEQRIGFVESLDFEGR